MCIQQSLVDDWEAHRKPCGIIRAEIVYMHVTILIL